ncbi:MAG: hypothetical protein EHM22_06450 [Actinobacteria bacterium]|nr:MAG: hypothetical protein EHM22_06450 [Actinomycetota bacterium]
MRGCGCAGSSSWPRAPAERQRSDEGLGQRCLVAGRLLGLGPPVGRPPAAVRTHARAIAFAGEHTAGDHSGTMEGALRSGKRAASQVLELLGRA